VKVIDQFFKDTSKQFSANIINSGVAFDLSRDITDPAGKRVFLKAGTEVTDSIRLKLNNLKNE